MMLTSTPEPGPAVPPLGCRSLAGMTRSCVPGPSTPTEVTPRISVLRCLTVPPTVAVTPTLGRACALLRTGKAEARGSLLCWLGPPAPCGAMPIGAGAMAGGGGGGGGGAMRGAGGGGGMPPPGPPACDRADPGLNANATTASIAASVRPRRPSSDLLMIGPHDPSANQCHSICKSSQLNLRGTTTKRAPPLVRRARLTVISMKELMRRSEIIMLVKVRRARDLCRRRRQYLVLTALRDRVLRRLERNFGPMGRSHAKRSCRRSNRRRCPVEESSSNQKEHRRR